MADLRMPRRARLIYWNRYMALRRRAREESRLSLWARIAEMFRAG